MSVTIRGSEFIEHPHELLDTRAVFVCDSTSCFEEEIGGPLAVAGEFQVEVSGGGGEGEIGGGGGGGGGGRRVVMGVTGIIVVLGRRRGQVFFIIHEKVEAFLVLLLLWGGVEVLGCGRFGAARSDAGGGVEGLIRMLRMMLKID